MSLCTSSNIRAKCKPVVTRTRSRCASHIGAVLRIPPPEGTEGWSLADLFISFPTSLAISPFPSFLFPLTIDQSHRSTAGTSGIASSADWITCPYWALQFSSSHEKPVPKSSAWLEKVQRLLSRKYQIIENQ